MARVNIMCSVTDNKCPAKMPRVGMWLIEIIEKGVPTTYQGILQRESITGQELTLQLLANALTVLRKLNIDMEEVAMYFNCQTVESAFLNKWLDKWQANEWNNAKGKAVPDKETWMLIWNLLTSIGKRYIACEDKSRYSDWMEYELKKEVEKIRNKEIAQASVEKVNKMLA